MLLLKGKKEFQNRCPTIQSQVTDYEGSLGLVVLVHRGMWVVLWIQLYANNKAVSAIFYLLKIRTSNHMFKREIWDKFQKLNDVNFPQFS